MYLSSSQFRDGILLPLILLLSTLGAVHFAYQLVPSSLQPFIQSAPYIAFGVTTVLGLIYARLRVLMTVLVLCLCYWTFSQLLDYQNNQWSNFAIELIFNAVTVLAPLNIVLFAYWTEKGSLITDLFSKFMILAAQILAVDMIIIYHYQPALHFLTQMPWPELHPRWLHLAPMAALSFAASAFLLITKAIRQPSNTHTIFLFTLVILFIVSQQLLQPGYLPAFMTLAGLLLAGTMVHESFNMAFKDDLTGLPGRRALNEHLAKLGRQYTLAMMDVDHFKKFNDTYGHDIGDQVLKMVAHQISLVNGGGKAYRYGGEEFTIVFANKSVNETLSHLEDVRTSIESEIMLLSPEVVEQLNAAPGKGKKKKHSGEVSVTISIGAAERSEALKQTEQVLKAADDALYRAKKAGRNQVSC